MLIARSKVKKVRLPMYWVGHVIANVFCGKYSHYYRDENNCLTFVVYRDDTDWQLVFPSANVIDVKCCDVVWIVFEKNKRHWHYEAKKEFDK